MMRAVILLLIATSAAVKGDNDCVQLIVGENAIVCVCNSTYCDSTPDTEVGENEYITYTSTRSGDRLRISIANFSSEFIASDIIFVVNTNTVFQTMFGFGGAMTDAAAINIKSLSNATQQNLIESYYGAEGNRYIFCRIPIAGTDFSTRPYTYDDVPGDITLRNFSLVKEDEYKIHYLHLIESVMPDPDSLKIFTTSWSAPAWTKTSGAINWGALGHKYYRFYANYILKFFEAYKKHNITIWGMTPGNEPFDGLFWTFPFNAMLWLPDTEAVFTTKYLAPTLSKAGYDLVYMAMDDQRYEVPWYVDSMFQDKEAKELFSGTAIHWYTDDYFSPSRLDELHNLFPDKFILMTEACAGANPIDKKKVDLGSWERGEQYLGDIIENIRHYSVGWVDWNLALDKQGGPNWAKNFVDSPIIVMPENDEFYKQPMYYALQHISKFVPPNSKRISIICLQDISTVDYVAFLTPEGNVVIVFMNSDNKPHNITIQDKMATKNLIYLQLPEKSFVTLQYQAS